MAEQNELLSDICNDILGYGPLEPLLARDDIADIMVNGANQVFIEVNGRVRRRDPFSRHEQLLISASASSARLAGASTNRARSATRV